MGFISWLKGEPELAKHHDTSLEQIIAQSWIDNANLFTHEALTVASVFRARQLLADRLAALPVVTDTGGPVPAPNASQSWQELNTEAMLSLQENGDVYFRVTQDGFKVLPYADMNVKWSDTRKINRRRLYEFELQPMRTSGVTKNLHVVSMNRGAQDLTGTGWMQSGAITQIINIDKYIREYFANNAMPAGIMSVPREPTEDEARLLKQQITASQANRTLMIKPTTFDFDAMGFNPTDSQWVESHLTSIGDVSNLSGVPAFLLAYSPPGSTQDYQNVETVLVRLWRETLQPTYAERLSEAYTELLEVQVTFDPREMFSSSMINRANSASVLVGAGYDAGDVAEAVGLPQMSFTEVDDVATV